MPANLENSVVAIGLEKVSFHSNTKERQGQRMLKLLHNCTHLTQCSVWDGKILQARLQPSVNCQLPDVQAGFRKDRRTRSNCQHLLDHGKSKRVPEKHLFLFYWLCQSLWLVWITINGGQFWKRCAYQTIWPSSWEIYMQVRKQQFSCFHLVKAMVFQWSCMDVRVGLRRKLSAEELMLLNCGVGEDSWESLGLQGDPTSSS